MTHRHTNAQRHGRTNAQTQAHSNGSNHRHSQRRQRRTQTKETDTDRRRQTRTAADRHTQTETETCPHTQARTHAHASTAARARGVGGLAGWGQACMYALAFACTHTPAHTIVCAHSCRHTRRLEHTQTRRWHGHEARQPKRARREAAEDDRLGIWLQSLQSKIKKALTSMPCVRSTMAVCVWFSRAGTCSRGT